MSESLFRRNALACEGAVGPICRCRCGGTLHGQPHSEDWIQGQLALIVEEREAAPERADEFYKRLMNGRNIIE